MKKSTPPGTHILSSTAALQVAYSVHRGTEAVPEPGVPDPTENREARFDPTNMGPEMEQPAMAQECTYANRGALNASEQCACYECYAFFLPWDVSVWVEDHEGDTAICPHCGKDAVLGDASGYPMTLEFLVAMNSIVPESRIQVAITRT